MTTNDDDSGEPSRVRRRVVYHGRVQGVGFRYTTASIARRFPIVGYVRNLSNGTVELIAESDFASLRDFLNQIDEALRDNICNAEVSDVDWDEELHGFRVRF